MRNNIKTVALVILVIIVFTGGVLASIVIIDAARNAHEMEKASHEQTVFTAARYASIAEAQGEFIDMLWDASIEGGTNLGCIYCHRNVVGG